MNYRGKNAWENSKEAAERSNVIFEGTPVRFELRWSLLTAKSGELISAEMFYEKDAREPEMVITFRVQRAYKGDLGSEAQLHTGLGGGDCGATYDTGLQYLIFSSGPSLNQLGVGMCSPGGWVEDSRVATDLRYLRKERPTPADLQPIRPWTQANYAVVAEEEKREYVARHERYAVATGRICGTVVGSRPRESAESVSFLSTLGYSPFTYTESVVKDDGSFCSPNLGPGSYYLYFFRGRDYGPTALYYPGTAEVAKATPVAVRAGQNVSNVVFKVSDQKSYSVRGFVSADQMPNFGKGAGPHEITVLLIRSDGDRRFWYSDTATFVLPWLGYFKINNVLPGHYVASVSVPGRGWLTRKVELDVSTHMKFINLDLVHKK